MKLYKIKIAVNIALLATVLFAENSEPLNLLFTLSNSDLSRLTIKALENSPALQVQKISLLEASANIKRSKIIANPTVSFGYGVPVSGDTAGRVNSYGVSIDWEISSIWGISNKKDGALFDSISLSHSLTESKWELVENVKLLNLKLSLLSQKRALTRSVMEDMRAIYTNAQTRLTNSSTTLLNVASAQRDYFTTRMEYESAKLEFNQCQRDLSTLIGDANWKFSDSNYIVWNIEISTAEELVESALTNRFDIRAYNSKIIADSLNLKSAKIKAIPPVSIGINSGRETDNFQVVGASISMEIPFKNRNQGGIAEVIVQKERDKIELETTISKIISQITADVEKFTTIQDELSFLDTLVNSQKQNFELSRGSLTSENIDMNTYLKITKSYNDSQLELIDFKIEELSTAIKIETESATNTIIKIEENENEK